MAFNYRPISKTDINSTLKRDKNKKRIIELFEELKGIPELKKRGTEIITIEINSSKGSKAKILTKHKDIVNIESLKARYKGLGIDFYDGTPPNKTAPTTAQQELITLLIFEYRLSSGNKNKEFGDIIDSIVDIWPNFVYGDSWSKSFELQWDNVKNVTKLPVNTFDVYNRDGGFMDFITRHIKSYGITQKDAWNPADIWLINKGTEFNRIVKDLENAVNIHEINDIFRYAFTKHIIVGISLKKNNGKNINYELVNLELKNSSNDVNMLKYYININFNKNKKVFDSVSSFVLLKYGNKTFKLNVRSNSSTPKNIVFEFSSDSLSAQLGKVPMNDLKERIKHYSKLDMRWKDDFKSPDDKLVTVIQSAITKNRSRFDIKGNLKDLPNNMSESWEKGVSNDNNKMMQILYFAYIITKIDKKNLNEFMEDLFYLSQKKGRKFGPFGKLY